MVWLEGGGCKKFRWGRVELVFFGYRCRAVKEDLPFFRRKARVKQLLLGCKEP